MPSAASLAPATYTPGAPARRSARGVDERIEHRLARTVIGDVAAAVGAYQWNVARDGGGVRALAERIDRRVLEQPQLVGRVGVAPAREATHRFERRQVVGAAEPAQREVFDQRHSTITTPGWSHSSWYRASSCSREVARTTQVTLRYRFWRLGRICIVAGSKSGACLSTTSITS